jgi:hypothetical protein
MSCARFLCSAAVCGVLSVVAAAPARADLVIFQFDGTLGEVPPELAGDFLAGEAVSYTLGLETSGMFGNQYLSPWIDFGGTVGDYAFSGNGGGTFYSLVPDQINGELHHHSPLLISGANVGASGEYAPLAAFSTWLFAPGTLAPVATGTLPIPTSATLEFLFAYRPDPIASPLLWVNGPTLTVEATSVSRIPEPSTLAILGVAFAVSGLRRTVFRRSANRPT